MKKLLKSAIVWVLGWQVRRLRSKNHFRIIGVAGSYGKTSTKFALAESLGRVCRVCYQCGNYNDLVSVPLVFFNETMPSLLSPTAWLKLFIRNEKQLRRPYDFDLVVLELGTDGPGQIIKFAKYVELDLAVVTSIAFEHMEFFGDLDSVAAEEFSIERFSKQLVVNSDLCDGYYLKNLSTKLFSYGFKGNCDYRICRVKFTELKYYFEIQNNGHVLAKPVFDGVARLLLYSFCAAIAVADLLELPVHEVGEAIKEFKPVSGRMQVLSGIKQSIIIDDTYNASPNATLAALDVLYGLEASHRIAVLGNMNELGKYSRHSHLEVGGHCDPKKLELLITIGPDANRYLATAAKQEGCRVKSFNDPIAAGEYLKSVLRKDTAVLFKGSQNRVYAEEAIKPILANQADSSRLVRQSTAWMAKKTASFRYNS